MWSDLTTHKYLLTEVCLRLQGIIMCPTLCEVFKCYCAHLRERRVILCSTLSRSCKAFARSLPQRLRRSVHYFLVMDLSSFPSLSAPPFCYTLSIHFDPRVFCYRSTATHDYTWLRLCCVRLPPMITRGFVYARLFHLHVYDWTFISPCCKVWAQVYSVVG